jgi:RimJ/RimL family protein N-acetyltransferase
MPEVVAVTPRLRLRWLDAGDAAFVLELLNDPDWIRNIGPRDVHTLEAAARYIEERFQPGYRRHGFGLNLVEARHGGEALGLCGLIKRDTLDDLDLGFAFLPRHRGHGYALEAAQAVMRQAAALGVSRVVAIVLPGNAASLRLLGRLGFRYERNVRLAADDDELELHAVAVTRRAAATPGG